MLGVTAVTTQEGERRLCRKEACEMAGGIWPEAGGGERTVGPAQPACVHMGKDASAEGSRAHPKEKLNQINDPSGGVRYKFPQEALLWARNTAST